jgi:hypothetical protein
MSAGRFTASRYETDAGTIHNIRVQPETLLAVIAGQTNAPPAGPVAAGVPSAKVTGSARKLGINARTVRLEFTGAVPTGYDTRAVLTIPWMTNAGFDAISRGSVGTYLGADVRVIGKSGEVIN